MSNSGEDTARFIKCPWTKDGNWTKTDWYYIDKESYRLMYLDGDHATDPNNYINQAIYNLIKEGKI